MSLDPLLLDVLACPEDKGPLLWFEDEDVLYNPRLRKSYAVVDGVPVLLTDEAAVVGEPEHERLMAKAETNQVRATGPGAWVSEQGPLDTLGMWEATAALPEQVSAALGAAGDAFGHDRSRRRRCVPGRGRVRSGHRDGWPLRPPPHSRRPTWPCPSGSGTGPPSRPSSEPTRWSWPSRPPGAPPRR